jgi:hypothetical protein
MSIRQSKQRDRNVATVLSYPRQRAAMKGVLLDDKDERTKSSPFVILVEFFTHELVTIDRRCSR